MLYEAEIIVTQVWNDRHRVGWRNKSCKLHVDNDVYLGWLGCVVNAFSLSPEGGGEEGRNRVEATPCDRGPRIATGGDP